MDDQNSTSNADYIRGILGFEFVFKVDLLAGCNLVMLLGCELQNTCIGEIAVSESRVMFVIEKIL